MSLKEREVEQKMFMRENGEFCWTDFIIWSVLLVGMMFYFQDIIA
jgi:hypothetical protein